MNKMVKFFKQKKYVYCVLGAAALVILGIIFFNNKKETAQTVTITHSDFVNQVYVSGKVIASEDVELAFEKEGMIERVYFSAGQYVKACSLIAKIDAKEAEKKVHDAEIALASARLALEKFELESSEENMNADLVKAYDNGFSAVSDAFLDLSGIIIGMEDVMDDAVQRSSSAAVNYRKDAEKSYYKSLASFNENRKSFRLVDRNSSGAEIEAIIEKTYETTKIFADTVKSIKNLVDYLADYSDDPSDFSDSKDTLSDYTDKINPHLSSLSEVKTDISDYKQSFSSADLDMKDLELTVKQKENSLQDAKNNLSDYYIRAPFDGLITNTDAKVGEIAAVNAPLVTLMSANIFQIESYVPEMNIALIHLGDMAKVTLDAYGEDILFGAKVVSVDPAETIRDGVSTYKIKLQFDGPDDRIKSGMTANVSIIIFSKPNVIVVPGGVVFEKDGKTYVQIKTDKATEDREVVLGSKSSLGQAEVVSGLEDGDIVVLNPDISLVK